MNFKKTLDREPISCLPHILNDAGNIRANLMCIGREYLEDGLFSDDTFYYEGDVLLQDNKSAITLQKRWPYSTRKGSKHIHVKYFFAVDKLKRKEIKLMHCPTEDMTADYNTKPLQGKSFIRFRDEIMGIREEDALLYKKRYAEEIKTSAATFVMVKITENTCHTLGGDVLLTCNTVSTTVSG